MFINDEFSHPREQDDDRTRAEPPCSDAPREDSAEGSSRTESTERCSTSIALL